MQILKNTLCCLFFQNTGGGGGGRQRADCYVVLSQWEICQKLEKSKNIQQKTCQQLQERGGGWRGTESTKSNSVREGGGTRPKAQPFHSLGRRETPVYQPQTGFS